MSIPNMPLEGAGPSPGSWCPVGFGVALGAGMVADVSVSVPGLGGVAGGGPVGHPAMTSMHAGIATQDSLRPREGFATWRVGRLLICESPEKRTRRVPRDAVGISGEIRRTYEAA